MDLNKIPILYKNAIYLYLCPVATGLLGLVFWSIVTHSIPAAEIGINVALLNAMAFVSTLSLLGLNYYLIKFTPEEKGNPSHLLSSVLLVTICASIIATSIFLLINSYSQYINGTYSYLLIILLGTITTVWIIYHGIFVSRRKTQYLLLQDVLTSVAKVLLIILSVRVVLPFSIIISWTLALFIGVAFSFLITGPKIGFNKFTPTLESLRKIWTNRNYCISNYITNTLLAASPMLLPLLVIATLGAEQNAYFYIGWTTGSLIFSIPIGASTSLFAEGVNTKEGLKLNIPKAAKLIICLLIPSILIVYLLGDKILLLFGKIYSNETYDLLKILVVSAIPYSFTLIHTTVLRTTKRVKELAALWVITVGLIFLTSYILMPKVGIEGVGYSFLGIHGLVMGYILLFRREVYK